MIARLLFSPSINRLREEITKTLASHLTGGNSNHPDLLYIKAGEKIGIAEARKIKEHFYLKPYSAKGRAVVIEDSSIITTEAQNALLKTIEELPQEAILILGASSDAGLLPTILSRCQIVILGTPESGSWTSPDKTKDTQRSRYQDDKLIKEVERLFEFGIEGRFSFIEKLKGREEFLHCLTASFREALLNSKSSITDAIVQHIDRVEIKNFLEELLQAEGWAKQNVNIRAILEYLMLVMPRPK